MDAAWSHMIAAMQASGRQAVLAITGGGTGAIAELLRVPGGSRLLLEAIVPYDPGSLRDYLGADPEQACSAETAGAMAERARRRAATLGKPDRVPIGLGATASLASDRPKHGDHRCHIAVATAAATDLTSIVLEKGRRDRPAEEDLVTRAITLCLARGCDVAAPSPSSLLAPGDRWTQASLSSKSPIDELLSGAIERVTVGADGQLSPCAPLPSAIMPGSFNPRHDGHTRLAQTAAEILGTPIHFGSPSHVTTGPHRREIRRRLDRSPGVHFELTRRHLPRKVRISERHFRDRSRPASVSCRPVHGTALPAARRAGRNGRARRALLFVRRRDAAGAVHSRADAPCPRDLTGLRNPGSRSARHLLD